MKKIFPLMLLLIWTGLLFGQAAGSSFQSTNNASAYYYSGSLQGSEKLKIPAYVWGQVRSPGLYIVPDDTNLLTLISLAGGPTENAKLSQVRIVRPTSEGDKVIWVDLKKYMDSGNEEQIPVMQPGDTVIISGTVYYAASKVADFFSKMAIIVSVFVALHNMN